MRVGLVLVVYPIGIMAVQSLIVSGATYFFLNTLLNDKINKKK